MANKEHPQQYMHSVQKELFADVLEQKETRAQVFSFEFCEIFKNTFFIEHFQQKLPSVKSTITSTITDPLTGESKHITF